MGPRTDNDNGRTDVVYVLLLLQGAIGMVAGIGFLVISQGNPLALVSGFGKPAFLFALAAGAVRGWQWTRKVTLVVEALSLVSFMASAVVGLLGEVDFTINLVTLITNVALPAAVIGLLMNRRTTEHR